MIFSLLCEPVVVGSDRKPMAAADIVPFSFDITEFPIYFTLEA